MVKNVSYARHCPLKNRKHLTSKLFYIPTLDLFRNVYSSAGGSHVTAPTPVLQQQRYRLSGSVLLAGIPNTISPVELYWRPDFFFFLGWFCWVIASLFVRFLVHLFIIPTPFCRIGFFKINCRTPALFVLVLGCYIEALLVRPPLLLRQRHIPRSAGVLFRSFVSRRHMPLSAARRSARPTGNIDLECFGIKMNK